ncbi:MAG TPA: DUF6338 family protein [Gemmatimonadales bacterium]|nr:DUF6338 family protein [Gemmatimonadales bacterium]
MLRFLLPGFLAGWVYFGLTAHPKPSEFERVVQALIFTVIIQGVVAGIRSSSLYVGSHWRVVGRWTDDVSLVWATVVALGVGLLVVRWANNDWIHRQLRKFRFTQETSFPSEWYGVLRQRPTYVVLHLSGERRLYGWPEEWPSDPQKGHFSMAEGEWLDDENKRTPLAGVSNILVPATEVSFVELMEPVHRPRETENHEPQSAPTSPEQAN